MILATQELLMVCETGHLVPIPQRTLRYADVSYLSSTFQANDTWRSQLDAYPHQESEIGNRARSLRNRHSIQSLQGRVVLRSTNCYNEHYNGQVVSMPQAP